MNIYKVTTEGDVEGKTIKYLGYATGEEEDIKDYYDNEKYYYVYTELITIKNITWDMVVEKNTLLAEKLKLEDRLKEIKKSIKE